MIEKLPWNFGARVFVILLTLITLQLHRPSTAVGWQAEPPPSTKIDKAIAQSTEFLLSRQGKDGAWHSEQYGAMKQGAASTALVLYALSHLPPDTLKNHSDAIQRASDFLFPGIEQHGCVTNPDGSLDYPVYSTALVLTANKRIGLNLKPAQIQRMVKYLLDSQCMEVRGFDVENFNHGGWDILGPNATQGKTAGANVSVTFYVVEALALVRGSHPDPPDDNGDDTNQHQLPIEWVQKIDVA